MKKSIITLLILSIFLNLNADEKIANIKSKINHLNSKIANLSNNYSKNNNELNNAINKLKKKDKELSDLYNVHQYYLNKTTTKKEIADKIFSNYTSYQNNINNGLNQVNNYYKNITNFFTYKRAYYNAIDAISSLVKDIKKLKWYEYYKVPYLVAKKLYQITVRDNYNSLRNQAYNTYIRIEKEASKAIRMGTSTLTTLKNGLTSLNGKKNIMQYSYDYELNKISNNLNQIANKRIQIQNKIFQLEKLKR